MTSLFSCFSSCPGPPPRRPDAACDRLGPDALAFGSVLVGPDVDPFVQPAELRIPGADQRRQLDPLVDRRPALDHPGECAGSEGVGADFEQRPDFSRLQRRRERRRKKNLALHRDDEFAGLRRPDPDFDRFRADRDALLEAVVGPDMGDLVQRADFGVPERGQLRQFLPPWKRLAEALFDLGERARLQLIGPNFDDHWHFSRPVTRR